jgi:Kef-type K+ transport system membrane component KefB
VVQLAVILIAAHLSGSLCHHLFRLPRVVGELCIGILIGPYALGGLSLPFFGPLFEQPHEGLPVSTSLYAVATLASILLLFVAGLETDVARLPRFGSAGIVVGLFGVVISFALGDLCAVLFGVADSFIAPTALFLGTLSTATSIGITARILTARDQMGSPEGATIMTAAVLDDVLGMILLVVVLGLGRSVSHGEALSWTGVGLVASKAFGFWLLCTVAAMLAAKPVSQWLKMTHNPGTISALALGLALLVAGAMERAGLAMIIGAYIAGLALSRTDLAEFLQDQLQQVYQLFVPVFFCVIGMLVDLHSVTHSLGFGIAFTLFAILAKVAGCGLPALLFRFNWRGALRIGIGMMPRGEVALIIASMGLTFNLIDTDLFGASVLMTLTTTVLAPPLLMLSFRGGSGRRGEDRVADDPVVSIPLELPSVPMAEFLIVHILDSFRKEEFFVHKLRREAPTWHFRKSDMLFTLMQRGPRIVITCAPQYADIGRMILLEEILSLDELVKSARSMKGLDELERSLATGAANRDSTPA